MAKETIDQHVTDDEAEAAVDGDSCGGVIGAEGVDTHHTVTVKVLMSREVLVKVSVTNAQKYVSVRLVI